MKFLMSPLGRSLRNKLMTLRTSETSLPSLPPAVSKGGLRFESPGVPRSGLRHVRQGQCSPQGGFWGPIWRAPCERFPALRQRLQNQAFMAAADRSRDPCQDTGTTRQRIPRIFAAPAVSGSPVARCAAALQRVEVMPEAFFQVRPQRRPHSRARVCLRAFTAPWRGFVTPPFPRQIRPVPARAAACRPLPADAP